jgi:SAM-dependent methyltransferase
MTTSDTDPVRTGYEAVPGRFQAVPHTGRLEDDPSPMVQELIARLQFTAAHVPLEGRNVLDYGCGTGVALAWLRARGYLGTLVGLDVSDGAIAFATQRYPEIDFRRLDLARPAPDLAGAFDVALCFEVLEHLHDPDQAIAHLARHYLRQDGILVATTPNRLVFSGGMEPSPINRTHVHEMDVDELRDRLGRWFEEVEVWGMLFRDPARMAAHARSVQAACAGYRRMGERWWNPWLNRFYRWVLRGGAWELMRGRDFRRWSAGDFMFDRQSLDRAIWFIAVARKPRR